MNFIKLIAENKLVEAKVAIIEKLNSIVSKRLDEAKQYIATDFEDEELQEGNSNIIRMGRINKIRRRIRRDASGKIVIQRNVRRSGLKGYRISGNTVKRISAVDRLRKSRLLKRSWKTTRRAKLRRTLLKRKLSMRRRQTLGLR
jgi:hypothetical protein